MTPASTRALFSAMKVENRSISRRAYQYNKKDTIGRKCHRRNAQQNLSSAERFSADRETLSRVLQSALIAGQGTHTVQEASHGHSSCARSEDPVWTWSWCTGLARASERGRERERRTDFCSRRSSDDQNSTTSSGAPPPLAPANCGILVRGAGIRDCQSATQIFVPQSLLRQT